MGARGRNSAEALSLTVIESRRPQPPAGLTEAEAAIWKDTVGASPPDWFKRSAFPVLVAFCRHTARAAMLAEQIQAFQPEWIGQEGGLQRLDKLLAMAERETRAVTATARALRLTPQSQIRATAAGAAMKRVGNAKAPWE